MLAWCIINTILSVAALVGITYVSIQCENFFKTHADDDK